jgi:hypothetical protein
MVNNVDYMDLDRFLARTLYRVDCRSCAAFAGGSEVSPMRSGEPHLAAVFLIMIC